MNHRICRIKKKKEIKHLLDHIRRSLGTELQHYFAVHKDLNKNIFSEDHLWGMLRWF